MKKTIAIACDHAALDLKAELINHLEAQGFKCEDYGTYTKDSCNYPDYAKKVCTAVREKKQDLGILVCGTGIGMSMCANKHRGIRAAVCGDTYSAKMTRCHNDANVLCIGARVTGSCLALDILDSFLGAEYEGGRHAIRVEMMEKIESK